jgi:hypothetical protein
MAQVGDDLLSKHRPLSSNPNTTKKKKKGNRFKAPYHKFKMFLKICNIKEMLKKYHYT